MDVSDCKMHGRKSWWPGQCIRANACRSPSLLMLLPSVCADGQGWGRVLGQRPGAQQLWSGGAGAGGERRPLAKPVLFPGLLLLHHSAWVARELQLRCC